MGRSKAKPIEQPDDNSCGPSSLKIALKILGIRRSLTVLGALCKTGKNGTTTKNLIAAANFLGLSVLAVKYATLSHLKAALKHKPGRLRATLVSYLYDLDDNDKPLPDSGHWATVAAYKSDSGRIVLLDSASVTKKSYLWSDFRSRWRDYDYKRRKINRRRRKFKLVRSWQPQLLLILAKNPADLPKFGISTTELFIPPENNRNA